MNMARENARLTHAQYQPGEFRSDNSGDYSLPNGADQRFMEVVNSIQGLKAKFFAAEGDVMVSSTSTRTTFNGETPEVVQIIADRFGLVETDNYSSPNVATFEYDDGTQ